MYSLTGTCIHMTFLNICAQLMYTLCIRILSVSSASYQCHNYIQGAVLGPEEFLEGVKLGGLQFVGGTVGGISGVLGKVTGVLGDTAANLTMDEEFQAQRKRTKGTFGQSLEGAAKVCVCVCVLECVCVCVCVCVCLNVWVSQYVNK